MPKNRGCKCSERTSDTCKYAVWLDQKSGSLDIGCGERSPEESLNIAEENQQLRKQIKALEKENKRLSEMNEFLEDAAAFFAASRQKSGKNKD